MIYNIYTTTIILLVSYNFPEKQGNVGRDMKQLEGYNATIPCFMSSKNQTKKLQKKLAIMYSLARALWQFVYIYIFIIRTQTRNSKFLFFLYTNFTLLLLLSRNDAKKYESYKAQQSLKGCKYCNMRKKDEKMKIS